MAAELAMRNAQTRGMGPRRDARQSARGQRSVSHKARTRQWMRRRLALVLALMLLSFLLGRYCTAVQRAKDALDVQLATQPVLQLPALPNGCEAASLTVLLRYAGFDADAVTLCRTYLPCTAFGEDETGSRTGADPTVSYAGDPESEKGWYCFEQPLAAAAEGYLAAQGNALRAVPLQGATQAQLEQLLREGTPVAVWVTIAYDAPEISGYTWLLDDGTEYHPYANLHCVVLTGISGDDYLVQDPLCGTQTVLSQRLLTAYTLLGSHALVLAA